MSTTSPRLLTTQLSSSSWYQMLFSLARLPGACGRWRLPDRHGDVEDSSDLVAVTGVLDGGSSTRALMLGDSSSSSAQRALCTADDGEGAAVCVCRRQVFSSQGTRRKLDD